MKLKSQTRAQISGFWLAMLLWAVCGIASAQPYSVNWYKIAGGGGTSTNTQYSISGTIGQPDAGGPMTAGGYSVTGGFWSLINVVQTPGVPNLIIVPIGANSVKVLWPDPSNIYTLQQNADLTTKNWVANGFSVTRANGTNSITIASPTGMLYFRLKAP